MSEKKTNVSEATFRAAEYLDRYFGQLDGATILSASVRLGRDNGIDEFWPTLEVILKNGEEAKLEISRDAEGNGPGFIFGLNAEV